LLIRKRIRNLTKAYGRAHEAHEVESVKEIHAPGLTLVVDAGNQSQSKHGYGVHANQQDERTA
jgi:hypothetical protein